MFLERIINALWGDLSGDELKKYLYLALGAFCLIGSFWPLKPLKESVFLNMVGSSYLVSAKYLSVIVTLVLVLFYTKLVDYFKKQNLIYAVLGFYSLIGLIFVFLLGHPTLGVANHETSPYRLVGWSFYLFVESYLTMINALYWSFISDISTDESAKKGYGMIIFGSQTGGLLFSFVGRVLVGDITAHQVRIPLIVFISILMFISLGITVWLLTHQVAPSQLEGMKITAYKKIGFFEGFKSVFTSAYMGGLFALIFLQEAITTVMGIELNRMVEVTYAIQELRTKFFFDYAVMLQFIACSFAFLGTSYVHRKFGTRACLVAFPVGLLGCALAYFLLPHLYVIVAFMLLIKSLHFALNQPVKESLYIPTSRDTKYKSKAWIDMFGMRGSKLVGANISKVVTGSTASVSGFVVAGLLLWTFLSYRIGSRNEEAIRNKHIIA